jgi:hypothetical protein
LIANFIIIIFVLLLKTNFAMFKENKNILQNQLFGFSDLLSEVQNTKIKDSKEYCFFQMIVCNINEKDFKPLFSKDFSRPNSPVNFLVGSLILKELNDWTFKELFDNIEFNLLTKTALGLRNIQEQPFSYTTIFNFKNRIADYTMQTGINLFEKVFDALTLEQINRLKLKTNMQRADTTMIDLNIRTYSRLELLIEILIRLHRDLAEADKLKFSAILFEYTQKTAQNQMYVLKSSDIPKQIEKIAQVYYKLHSQLQSNDYENVESFKNFIRVFKEHFILIENTITVKENKELNSSILQSPDAPDATYRNKRGEDYHGLEIFVNETCNPENPIQLISDIAVYQNNIDDTQILNQRVEVIKEKTPDLSQLHTDGGFGNAGNDQLLNELQIVHVQTAVRGRKSEVELNIEQNQSSTGYTVSCPNQSAESSKTTKNNKVVFDIAKCSQCPFMQVCKIFENKGIYYFSDDNYTTNKRKNIILTLPLEQRKLRPNVEATVNELLKGTNSGKLRVRKTMSVLCYAFNRAISINLGRIHRYFCSNPDFFNQISRKVLFRPIIFKKIQRYFDFNFPKFKCNLYFTKYFVRF